MRLWMGPIAALIFLCPWILGNSECNAFSGVASKTGDQALLFQARQQIDQGDFSGAITTLASMSASAQSGHDGVVLAASAHAGKCGLNLVQYGYDLANGLSSGTKLMAIALYQMRAATSITECVTAETLMLGLPQASLSADDNVFIAFIEFAKIGAELEVTPGVDTSAHQGAVNNSLNPCNIGSGTLQDIGYGLLVAINAINTAGVSIGGPLTSICTAPGLAAFCAATSAGTVPALAVGALLKSNEIGFNLCGGSVGTGTCTCP